MLLDMKCSYNVTPKTSQHFIYFGLIEVELLIGRNNKILYIDYIKSDHEFKGFASRTLDEISYYADRHGVTLLLEVKPLPLYDHGIPKLNEQQLIEWYNRHGFVVENFINQTGKTRAEMGGYIDMIRMPKYGIIKP